MAKRIDNPEVGVEYFCDDGSKRGVYWIHHNRDYFHGWQSIKFGERNSFSGMLSEWNFYDADPTAKPALPALDLSKPVKRRDGFPIRLVRKDGDKIRFQSFVSGEWMNSERHLSGRTYDGEYESPTDLIQCVRCDWTQSDVPYPRPRFRRITDQQFDYPCGPVGPNWIEVAGITRNWKALASDWEYTTDGKTWNPCCKWE